MINELTIKGLKCFDEVEFSFENLTLLAGKNSLGKSTVIQALLAMIQEGRNPFRGQYIDIGRISELKNKYVGSKEIEITVNHKFVRRMTDDKNEVISEGRLYERLPKLLNLRLFTLPSPASEQKMNSLQLKSRIIVDSSGFKVVCSFWLPGKISKARGIPSASINKPIVTIGFGLFSLLFP